MTDKLPTPSIRNAIAFVDYFGTFARGTHIRTRLDAQRWEGDDYVWVKHVAELDFSKPITRFYNVLPAGREIAARGSLAGALAWLTEQGFKHEGTRDGKGPKLGYIGGFSHPDGRTAWISNSQSDTSNVYITPPRGSGDWRSVLSHTAKASSK